MCRIAGGHLPNVSVIATATNTVIGTIPVGLEPLGVAVTPDGSKVYVANSGDSNVSVIATATDTVVGSPIAVGNAPVAFGLFIQPSSIPFSIFAAQLTVYPVQAQFAINASFTLGATSNGINPPTEPVTLQIGGFTVTIPPRSFVPSGQPGYWTFVGVINGENLTVMIKQRTGNNYIFGIIAKNVQLSVTNPVTVTLTIGNDKGSTSVTPVIINTK
jgi:YVTN family beta-propeller protein